MYHLQQKWNRKRLILVICLLLGIAPSVFAQKVSIKFDDFHGYLGTVDYLKKVGRAYPNITELHEIGKSTKERSIYVLIITNVNTGTTIDAHVRLRNMRKENVQNVTPMKPYNGKPGHWIDGGTHGNEYTGTEVCLYIIDKLVSGYSSNPELTKLIDDNTFYICPIVNPDGIYNSVEGGISQRNNSMAEDNDKDGKINEDGPDDLNGDGHITQFRYKDPEGRYVLDDIDPRVLVRLERDETTAKQRYSVIREDKDNDGDGERGEDSERGIDINRNFPEGWFKDDGFQGGQGYYPSSSPESHAILEFFTNNTNILMVQSYHTSGGFTYRPLARWPDKEIHARDIAVFDMIMGKKYLELIGDEVPDAWKEEKTSETPAEPAQPSRKGALKSDFDPPRGWRHPYNDSRDCPYGYGLFLDWAYAQFGAYSMSTVLWNWRKDTKAIPGYNGENDRVFWERTLLKYQDEQFGGKRFIPWKKFNHAELGEGEIGGWLPKYSSNNAIPGESLLGVCETHWQFELFKAKLLPHIEITEVKERVLYATNNAAEATVIQKKESVTIKKDRSKGRYKIVEVTATIENTGKLPTHITRGATLSGNREDAVWLLGDCEKITYILGTPFMSMGILAGTMEIPGYEPEETPEPQPGFMMQQRMRTLPFGVTLEMMREFMEQQTGQTGNKRQMKWLVAIEGYTTLKIIVTSQKGGTKVKKLTIQ